MIPLFTSEQIRAADKYAISELGIPGAVLMENASRDLFEKITNYFDDLDEFMPIGIVAGRGNNGGDGFALARHFANRGYRIKILALADDKELKGDALLNYKVIRNLINGVDNIELRKYKSVKEVNWLKDCQLIIDALLGTGAKGKLKSPYDSIIRGLNAFNSYKASVDIPTGLDVESASGDPVFDADITVSLGELKRGLFYGDGYRYSGDVVKGYIGIGTEYFDALPVNDYLIEPEDAFNGLPVKELNSHKYSAGKVLVIAGSGRLPGASILTANSALRGGAGAAILAFPESIKTLAQSQLKSAVVEPYKDNSAESLSAHNIPELNDRIKWADVVAVGPGLGRTDDTGAAVKILLKRYSDKKIVLDADAIYPLNDGVFEHLNLKNKILTPHHKEFADLIGLDIGKLHSDILNMGRDFVTSTGAYLVLKGAPTIIFTPKGEALINSSGNPGLAKFGSGDVLTGLIAAFVSQSNDIENALTASVYIHSLTADLLLDDKSEFGINAEDLVDNIPSTISFLRNSFVRSL